MNPIRSIRALMILLQKLKVFSPEKVFAGKRVAVIGAAASAFEEENGPYIDSFDIVVRVNKALYTWKPEQEKSIGRKTDVLFHSFFENESSGGGPIDERAFAGFGMQYLVQPLNNHLGLRSQLNFYKRHLRPVESYVLSKKKYKEMAENFKEFTPTIGFSALYSVLTSPCSEVFITGFTFFKTPYAKGYRDHLLEPQANQEHIDRQGLHSPDLEFKIFKERLAHTPCQKVTLDQTLTALVKGTA